MHPVGRLEQRRDLDLPLDAEQPRVVERREQRERRVGLRDQQPNRRAAVEVLLELRGEHEHALRGRLLARDRAVVHVHGLHRVEQARDRGQEMPARRALAGRRVERDVGPDRVVQLHGVQPKVQSREIRAPGSPIRRETRARRGTGSGQVGLEQRRQRGVDRADRVLLQRALLERQSVQPAEPRRVVGFAAERLDAHREALGQRAERVRDRVERLGDARRRVRVPLAHVVEAPRSSSSPASASW